MKKQLFVAMGLFLLTAGWAAASSFSSWSYVRSVNLSTATATNGYQVRIDLTTNNFNYANADPAGNDLRFQDTNTLQSLSYWIQSWTNAGTSTVWVALGNAGTTAINLYYGNPAAPAASSGTNTFTFFDDFSGSSIDTNRWFVDDATGWSVAGGELKGVNTYGRIHSRPTFSAGVILESKSRRVILAGNGYQIIGFFVSTGNAVGLLNHPTTDYCRNDGGWNGLAATSPDTVNLLTRLSVKSSSLVDLSVANFNTGASYQNVANIGNTVSSEPVALGYRFDNAYGGQAYEAYWDWIRVRLYAASEPAASVGAEQYNIISPTFVNAGVSNVTTTSAMASATMGVTNADVYLFWDTQNDGQTSTTWANTNFVGFNISTGLISGVVMSNLAVGQTYYFRFYGTNTTSGGTGWSTPVTFNTGQITVTATVASVSEAGPGSGQFTLYRPANLTNAALTVNFTISGTAVAGTDYQTLASSTSVTIPAGSNSATIAVTPIDNTLADGNRTVTLTLQPGGYLMGVSSNATVTILDDELPLNAFSYKAQITFSGYSQSEVLTNFPALVVFATNAMTNFSYNQVVSTNGYDVAFYDNSVPPHRLNHEVDKWDPTTNSLLWVQVPVLTSGTIIWAYWGNAAAALAPAIYTTNGAAWSSDYVLVHHLAGTNGTTVSDSTTNRFNGAIQNQSDTALAAGKAGAGLSLGATGYYNLPNISSKFNGTNATLMFWDKANDAGGARGFVYLDQSAQKSHYPWDTSAYIATWRTDRPSWTVGATGIDRTQWHLVTVTTPDPANGKWRFYQNATVACEASATSFTLPATPNIGSVYTFGNYLQAVIDEVRISNVARSSNYVWACYMTVASNAVFASYGAEQPVVADAPVIQNLAAQNVQSNAADLVGNLFSGGPATVTCYWGTNDGLFSASAWMTNTLMGSQGVGNITNSLASGLLPGTVYYYRYYATNSASGVWAVSPVSTFCTLGAPTVNNSAGASPVGPSSATLNGTLVAGNPAPATWIYWGTSDGGTTKGSWTGGALSTGTNAFGTSFSAPLSGLIANTQYWYRCYASNNNGEAWAPASTNFTTIGPALTMTPLNGGVVQGTNGTTVSQTYTVTLSANSALPVSVMYATSNGTATAASNGYVPASGTLTIPAGSLTTTFSVSVLGTNAYKAQATFYVNFSNAVNATLGTPQVSCTITNNYYFWFVRGDGAGSNANDGSDWNHAFATLNYALSAVPVATAGRGNIPTSTPCTINVQASTGAQAYAVASRSISQALDLDFEGGWQNVNTAPVQSGVSVVMDVATNKAGISLTGASHGHWRRVVVNRVAFTNVTRGVEVITDGGSDGADILLAVSNTTVCAQDDGIFLSYPKGYAYDSYGGLCRVTAQNVDIVAGLGGTGGQTNHGVYVNGAWVGSSIGASGTDPATGAPRVSTITSLNGCGVYFAGINYARTFWTTFSNLVVTGCSSNGLYLDALPLGAYYPGPSTLQATLNHCTVAGNAGDGLQMAEIAASSGHWAALTNCIVANNGGHGINLGTNGPPAFTCTEGYNVFFNDDIYTNGAAQAFAGSTASADPLFYGQNGKPSPWYLLRAASSPACRRGSDGLNRGAYQNNKIPACTAVFFR